MRCDLGIRTRASNPRQCVRSLELSERKETRRERANLLHNSLKAAARPTARAKSKELTLELRREFRKERVKARRLNKHMLEKDLSKYRFQRRASKVIATIAVNGAIDSESAEVYTWLRQRNL